TAEPRVSGAPQKFASAPVHDPPALLATMTSTPGTPKRNASPAPDVLAEIGSKPIVERPDAPQPPECAPAFAGERRQVTVLSCEAVIPAELSSDADLEDLRDAIDAYHRCVAETAARFM